MTRFLYLMDTFRTIHWYDILDILIVAYLIYQAIKLVRETRAAQLVKGIGALLALNLLADKVGLQTMSFLMSNILQIGLFALVVVFQPELRRALEQVGRTRISKLNVFSQGLNEQQTREGWRKFIAALVDEAASLSRQKIGALVVIEQKTKLGDIIKTGTIIDSAPTPELIGNIFFPNSPLHDGAMIVRDGRLYAAGCFLPLSDNSEISRELGTRHRAALGMSEASDAIIVVVSEETGLITVCQNGRLERGYSLPRLEELLKNTLIPEKAVSEPSEKKFELWKGKKK
ncbi:MULTISPECIES: diadenylate cyclase CdaA [Anaerotruncus]|jgi:diadenylate cyclase|uniref:diadenylate cyclase CdaA n=1 Tax=Anaerotruncus TaxID=244127 RepID=UPI00082AA07A|nr:MULTISPECIES: diadenylate cyclase CdaA [Anaerotruncus]RGX56574.1 TIGR00159 family protein [Anaerotruncus sp. AF02-27]